MIKAEWTNKDALDLQPTCNKLATNVEPKMRVVCHEDDYFERTPIEKQRVCCNCRNRKASETVSKCMIDGHYVGYVQCFTNWCVHWATDELKWIGGDDE